MTNADYIRSMGDNELSYLLCSTGWMLGEEKECCEWLQQKYEEDL